MRFSGKRAREIRRFSLMLVRKNRAEAPQSFSRLDGKRSVFPGCAGEEAFAEKIVVRGDSE